MDKRRIAMEEKNLDQKELENIIIEMKKMILNDGGSTPRAQVVLLAGAGVSAEKPSSLSLSLHRETLSTFEDITPTEASKLENQLRPEVFFQILYNQLGEQGLVPLEALNTKKLNETGYSIQPNGFHYFLAKMIELQHIVITTNFDSLIEDAYFKQTENILTNVAIYDDDFKNLGKIGTLNQGYLIKIHGSFFSPDGKDTKNSIEILLQQLQRKISHHKTDLIRRLIKEHNWIVMGYSGRDDYDIYTLLSDPEISKKKIFWIKRQNHDNNTSILVGKRLLLEELKRYGSKSSAEISWEEHSLKNIYSILASYQNKNGVLVKANPLSLIQMLWKPVSREDTLESGQEMSERIIKKIIQSWSRSLRTNEKKKISAELLKALNDQNANQKALNLYKFATLEEITLITARSYLEESDAAFRIVRKKLDHTILSNGKMKGKIALKLFQDANDIEGAADAFYVLTHLNRVENQVNESVKCGIAAIDNYFILVKSDPTRYYKLAQALRALALVIMNSIPDIPPLKESPDKRALNDLLICCAKLCELAEKIYGEIGNITGERGLNQTLNIHGLISIRRGDYRNAEKSFKNFVRLSDSSRFIRESFQAYRNLGICYLYLAMDSNGLDKDICSKTIESFENCLVCLGVPLQTIPELIPPEDSDIFNSLYNYARALVFCSNNKADAVIRTVQKYNNKEKLSKLFGSGYWHWQCILLALLCQAETNDDIALGYAKQMFELYKMIGIDEIKKHKFGQQNYNENVAIVSRRLHTVDIKPVELPQEFELVVPLLPYNISEMTKRLEKICTDIDQMLSSGEIS